MQELSWYQKRALEIRNRKDRKHNCAQAILIAFGERMGLDEDLLYGMAANLGRGMKMYSVCGGITGGIMVLGLAGLTDEAVVNRFYSKWRRLHDGFMECANFLEIAEREHIEERAFCNNLVVEGVRILEQTLVENGISPDTLTREYLAA